MFSFWKRKCPVPPDRQLLIQFLILLEMNVSAVTDLTAGVAALKVSVDAAAAKLGTPVVVGDDPAVVQAVADVAAMKAELDAALAGPAA